MQQGNKSMFVVNPSLACYVVGLLSCFQVMYELLSAKV